jgi:hypothetical protein
MARCSMHVLVSVTETVTCLPDFVDIVSRSTNSNAISETKALLHARADLCVGRAATADSQVPTPNLRWRTSEPEGSHSALSGSQPPRRQIHLWLPLSRVLDCSGCEVGGSIHVTVFRAQNDTGSLDAVASHWIELSAADVSSLGALAESAATGGDRQPVAFRLTPVSDCTYIESDRGLLACRHDAARAMCLTVSSVVVLDPGGYSQSSSPRIDPMERFPSRIVAVVAAMSCSAQEELRHVVMDRCVADFTNVLRTYSDIVLETQFCRTALHEAATLTTPTCVTDATCQTETCPSQLPNDPTVAVAPPSTQFRSSSSLSRFSSVVGTGLGSAARAPVPSAIESARQRALSRLQAATSRACASPAKDERVKRNTGHLVSTQETEVEPFRRICPTSRNASPHQASCRDAAPMHRASPARSNLLLISSQRYLDRLDTARSRNGALADVTQMSASRLRPAAVKEVSLTRRASPVPKIVQDLRGWPASTATSE